MFPFIGVVFVLMEIVNHLVSCRFFWFIMSYVTLRFQKEVISKNRNLILAWRDVEEDVTCQCQSGKEVFKRHPSTDAFSYQR